MYYGDLASHYRALFGLSRTHQVASLTEIDSMIPYERDVYQQLLKDELQVKEDHARQAKAIAEAQANRRF